MTYESPYGKPEGLRGRLEDWIERLKKDQGLPWMGLGLIADLECAIQSLAGGNSQCEVPQTQEYDL